MKTKNILLAVICSLSLSTAAQNMPGGGNNGNVAPGSGKPRQNLEHGLNNPALNNTNFPNLANRAGGITNGIAAGTITNRFGYGDLTNRFGSRLLTNGFGDRSMTNRFGGYTNSGMMNEYINTNGSSYANTNRHQLKNPYFTDPRVMGNNGLSNTN